MPEGKNVYCTSLNIRRKCKSRVSAERMLPEACKYTGSQFFYVTGTGYTDNGDSTNLCTGTHFYFFPKYGT